MSSVQLNVLGRFEARLSSGEVLLLPTRKAEVLLTYLAMAPGLLHSRDRLIDLLWSDRSEDQARNSLRQTLSALKKSLEVIDPLPLQIDRTTVSVVTESIDLDTLELERSIKAGNSHLTAEIGNLYRGEFLEGIVIRDPNAEEWLMSERDRYRRMAVGELESLLTSQREAGALDSAVETGERLVILDPLRESAWRHLMEVYAARGERSQALKAYNRCMAVLDKELGIEPEQEMTALQAMIRDGSFDTVLTDIQPGPMNSVARAPAVTAGLPVPASTEKPSIVVLPFICLGTESSDEYFADGLTEDIIANLCRYRELFVIAHQSAFAYRDSNANIEHPASQIGVEYAAKGNIRRSGDQIRISIHLIEAATGKTVWAERIDRKFDELFALVDEVAARIASNLVSHIEDESSARATRKHPQDLTAFDCVMRARKGVDSFDPEQNASARRLLEQAIELDPEYAAAYAYLAWSCCVEAESPWGLSQQEADDRAVALARKAVALDEFDPDGHVGLGWAYLHQKKFDLAEAHLDRAIECNPNNYDAFCVKSWLLALSGRASEVTVCGATALRLNPLAPDNCLLAIIIARYVEGRYDAALEMLARIREPDENSEAWRAACLAQSGRDSESRAAAANALEMGGDFINSREWLHLWVFKDPQDLQHFIDGLNKSGVLKNSARTADKISDHDSGAVDENPGPSAKSSIAVLQFTNLSEDPGQQYFADGMTAIICGQLSRIRSLQVKSGFNHDMSCTSPSQVSRELGVGYLLGGSVQREDDRVRVFVELTDCNSGEIKWADRFDRRGSKVIEIQDDIACAITATLWSGKGTIREAEHEKLCAKPTQDFNAFDYILKGIYYKEKFSSECNLKAHECFDKAIALDPGSAEALGWRAWIHVMDVIMGYADDNAHSLALAYADARNAIAIDPYSEIGHWALAATFGEDGDFDRAFVEYDKALEINPSNSDLLVTKGGQLSISGRFEEGIKLILQGINFNKHHPEWYFWDLGAAYFAANRLEEAIEAFNHMNNHNKVTRTYLAACYAQTGDLAEAQNQITELFRIDAEINLNDIAESHSNLSDDSLNLLMDGLKLVMDIKKPPGNIRVV